MEVLLLQDIPGVGKKDDLLMVGDGYAMNFLLPQGTALVATPTVRRRYAEQIRRRALEREEERMSQVTAAKAVAGKDVSFTRKVTKTGKLYAAITATHIADALKEQHGIEVSEDAVSLAEPIKATGEFEARVKIAGAEQAVQVTVQPEE